MLLALLASLEACTDEHSPGPPDPSTAPSPSVSSPTESASPTESTSPTASEAPGRGVKRLVVPAAESAMPPTWREAFVVPYGRGRQRLGTSPGGDSGSLDIGPEYGAPGPDGTWWFLDYAKGRIAHFDGAGSYLDQVRIPRRLLVGGLYYQWTLPHVLADGTLVAVRLDGRDAWMLRLRDGVVDEVRVRGLFSPAYDDGTLLYGSLGRGRLASVDPADGSRERVTMLRTPSGTPFFVGNGFDNGRLRVDLPNLGVSKTLPTRTSSGALAHVGAQIRVGADDTVHVFLSGIGEDDESVQLVGYTSVSPTGAVSQVEPLTNPFNDSDPGSASQLVIAPGSSTPMLVYVLGDGVHVYERTG